MKRNLLTTVIILWVISNHAFAQTLVKNMSSANSDVYAVYKKGSSYYIGGAFTYVGLNTGYGALTKTSNDAPNLDFPQFNGQLYSLIPDGSGGWYAGGNFTSVGGVSKSYVAHINSNNTVDASFNANCNGQVKALLKVGTRLYIGGGFSTVNGTPRLNAAAVSASTGSLVNAWNPAPNSTVNTIAGVFGVDTTFWLGGSFTTINATNLLRPYLAKVNSTNGNFISGSLSADYIVNKIVTKGDSIYVAGDFSRFGLKTDYLSSITEGGTNSDQSMPNTNGSIRCIIPDGSGGWYVGGAFTQIGSVSKNYVAHVKSDKTVDAGFSAVCNNAVYAMVKDGAKLYLGGAFSTVNSTPRNYLATVNASTGALITTWDPNSNNYIYTLALKDTVVLAGGNFTTIKGQNAYHFAALSKTDGSRVGGFVGYNNQVNKISVLNDSVLTCGYYTQSAYYTPSSAKVTTTSVKPDPRFPATNGQIYSVIKDGSGNFYVGGSFTTIGGVNQAYLAKLNSSFNVITAWAPQINGSVRTMILAGTTLYIGGTFNQTNTVSRPYISAVGTANPGSNKTWNSAMSSYVYSLVTDGTSIYAGGIFTTVNGSTSRNLLAKFNLNGTLDATWNPNATGGGGSVEELAISGTNILAGGSFTTVGGVARNYLAKLNNTNGNASNWAIANSYVYALYVDGTTCYVGGYFTSLTSATGTLTPRNYFGAITIANGNIGTFNPNPNSYVFAINKSGTNLYYGGQFTNINGTNRYYLASCNTSGTLQSWDPSANGSVNSISIDASNNVFIGGSFTGFQELARNRASLIKYASQALDKWAPVIDNVVYDITYNASKIFIGGAFHNVNGSARNGLAAFNLKGVLQSTDLSLTKAGTSNVAVWSLVATPTKIYAGGDFDKAGTSLRSDFVEADISSGSGSVLATNPSADAIVYAINVQGTTIAYGGDFRFSNFSNRNYLGVIRKSTGNVVPWTPLPDSYVFDVAVNYNRIFIVGQFDNVNGAPHPGAVAFNLSNGALTSWNPQLTRAGNGVYADLNAVLADSNYVYLGGYFDQVAGNTRNNAAIVAATNAALQPWDPEPSNRVYTIAKNGINLFIGGEFTFCKGAARQYIAKIDSATGLVNASWNPGANGYVRAITGSGPNIYIGGNFTQLGGITRTSLGAVAASTGAATSFDPVVQSNGSAGTVYALAFDDAGVLYAGGTFNAAKATTRNNLAAFATSGSGTLKPWDPNANTTVNALAVNGAKIFVGGNFTLLNGATTRNYLASVNNTNGTVTTFNPNLNSYVYCLSLSGGGLLYAGGSFTTVNGGTSRSYLASYDGTTGALKTWNPISNSYIFGIASSTDTVYMGGYLSTLNGINRGHLGAVRGAAGTQTLGFNPDLNSYVYNSFISEYTLLEGGSFTTLGGNYRGGFAVFSLPGAGHFASSEPVGAEQQLNATEPLQKFAVFPNPAPKGAVTLRWNNITDSKLAIKVTSADGRTMFEKTMEGVLKNNHTSLNLSSLAPGVYTINVIGNKTIWSSNIVIP